MKTATKNRSSRSLVSFATLFRMVETAPDNVDADYIRKCDPADVARLIRLLEDRHNHTTDTRS